MQSLSENSLASKNPILAAII